MKSHSINNTFGFCQCAKSQPGKTKRAIFSQRSTDIQEIKMTENINQNPEQKARDEIDLTRYSCQ